MAGPHRTCGDVRVEAGRRPSQLGWYRFAAGLAAGKTVLDVGSGMGKGLEVLRAQAREAWGLEVDPRLAGPQVMIGDVGELPDAAYEVLVCIDVLEHVADDRGFLGHLLRVARESVFITTPNWSESRRWNEYHVREYTPREFHRLFAGQSARFFWGEESGDRVVEARRWWAWEVVNELYNRDPTRVLMKAANRAFRFIRPHQAALVAVAR